MRAWQAILIALVLALGLGVYLFREPIALHLAERELDQALTLEPRSGLPDGLAAGVCGSGSPMPSPERAGPCIVVQAGDHLFLVDAGDGAVRNLARMRFPVARLEGIFLTHFHSDHFDGLGAVLLQRWGTSGAASPLPVYGPRGVEQVVQGLNLAYAQDRDYRVAHHGAAVMPPTGQGGDPHPFDANPDGSLTPVLQTDGLSVYMFQEYHDPAKPAVGYVFDYKGRRLVISGDTRPNLNLYNASKGADLLVCEALSPVLVGLQHDAALRAGRPNLAHIFRDIVTYHTTPEQAADIASRAQVRRLVLVHIIPPVSAGPLEGVFLGRARNIYRGPLQIGRDGDVIFLPAHSNREAAFRRF